MDLTVENKKETKSIVVAEQQAIQPAPKSSNPISVHDTENPQNNIYRTTEGLVVETSGGRSPQTSNNEGYILQKLENILHGKAKLDEGQKKDLIERISGETFEIVIKKDSQEINKIFDCLLEALNDLDGDFDSDELAQIANGYYIAITYGCWKNISQFRRAQNGGCDNPVKRAGKKLAGRKYNVSLNERLERTGQTLDKYMEYQFGKNSWRIKDKGVQSRAKAAGMSVRDYINKIAFQDLSKLLINSSKEEKFQLVAAVKHLEQSDNIDNNCRIQLLKMIFANLTAEDRKELADRYANDKELLKMLGEDANAATIQSGTHIVSKNVSEKGAKELNESINKTVTDMEGRITKLEDKENLTDSEQQELKELKTKLDEQYTPMMVGNTTGSEANENITTETLTKIVENNTSHSNKEEVMTGIAEYTTEHSDEMLHTEEEFRQIMNEATDGEYLEIENTVRVSHGLEPVESPPYDSKNSNTQGNTGTTGSGINDGERGSELNTNTEFITSPVGNAGENLFTAQNSSATGLSGESEEQNSSQISTESLQTQTRPENEHESYYNTDPISQENQVKRISTRLKEEKKGSLKYQLALKEYETSSNDTQLKILKSGLSTSIFIELINYTSLPTLQKFIKSGEKGPDVNATLMLKEKLKELEEKETGTKDD